MTKIKQAGLPSPQEILTFITTSQTPAGKREIARAFGLRGTEKIALKALLKDMADEGLIDSAPGRAFHKMGGVPKVTALRIIDVSEDGIAYATPEIWQSNTPPPRLRVMERNRRHPLGIGDRILARTEEQGNGWIAHPLKKLERGEALILGILKRDGDKLWLKPVDKREKHDWIVSDAGQADAGDLVLAEKAGRPPRVTARVTEILGDPFAPRSFSLVAIHKHGIPNVFSQDTLDSAEKAATFPLGNDREDLRHLPIVAIDPADARDHDDAVWGEPDTDPSNPGGFKAIVAIADVSFYVRPGSDVDREARRRGNSVYFPDRVVPMLPEILSADVCSLKAGEDRAALVCHLTISQNGALKSFHFTRAVVRLAANIAYEDAQAAYDGKLEHPLTETALKPIWACWLALAKGRDKREPLDLDLPERRVVLDEKGHIMSVAVREQLPAHRLIEDFMIAANVAAAKALEAKKAPVIYRDHEPPSREKLVTLKDFLATFDIPFAMGQVIKPATFNQIINLIGPEHDARPQIMEQILRSQTQAYYSPVNAGHFGLSLGSYAHFTSPIRRYADLIVHRSLVSAYGLGTGGLPQDDAEKLTPLAEKISQFERRAMEAERETVDRYVAAYLSSHVGDLLDTRITGVQSFGFFATVEGLGGDGLVPVSTLGTEYFRYDEQAQALIGETSQTRYESGMRLQLRLAEADPITGALRFELPEGSYGKGRGRGNKARVMHGKRGRPSNIRHQGRKR